MAFTFDGFTMDAHNNFGQEEDDEEEEGAFLPLPTTLRRQEGMQVQYQQQPGEEDGAVEEIPIMPPAFYEGVDLFLRKSPPRLKGKKRMDVEASAAIGKSSQKSSSRSVAAAPRRSAPAPSARITTLDTSLLHEAFAYTDRILREAVHEEAQAERQGRMSGSGSNNNSHHQLPERRGGSAGSAMAPAAAARNPYSDNPRSAPGSKGSSAAKERTGAGLVKRLRQQTQPSSGSSSGRSNNNNNSSSSSGFDLSRLDDEAARKNEFDSLVLNFQQGLTLKKLQAELAASQQAMRRSEGMVREIAGAAGFR